MSGKKHQIANNQDKDKTIPFKEKRCFIKNVFLNFFQRRTERIKLKREILKQIYNIYNSKIHYYIAFYQLFQNFIHVILLHLFSLLHFLKIYFFLFSFLLNIVSFLIQYNLNTASFSSTPSCFPLSSIWFHSFPVYHLKKTPDFSKIATKCHRMKHNKIKISIILRLNKPNQQKEKSLERTHKSQRSACSDIEESYKSTKLKTTVYMQGA